MKEAPVGFLQLLADGCQAGSDVGRDITGEKVPLVVQTYVGADEVGLDALN